MAHGIILPRDRHFLATQLHGSLERKLRDVQNARFEGQWIDFDGEGNLLLHAKPTTVLECVWEILVRLFTSKYERIDREIRVLTAEVNDYFSREDDPNRRAQFQTQFTRSIFEICRCADKLAQRGKIRPDIASVVIPAKGELQRVVIPEMHADSLHHRFHGLLSFGNEMQGASVRFGFEGEGERELTGISNLHNVELRSSDVRHYDVKSSGTKLTLFADVIRTHSVLVKTNMRIVLEGGGSIVDSELQCIPKQQGVSFQNRADHTITISEIQVEKESSPNPLSGTVQLMVRPQTTQLFPVSSREGEEYVILSFKTSFRQVIPLQIGCKLARYFIKINPQGELVMSMSPLVIDTYRDRPDHDVPIQPADMFLQPEGIWGCPNPGEPCVLMTLRSSNGKVESIFIGQGTVVNKSFEQLREHFGLEWDGRFIAIAHYPKPTVNSALPNFSQKGVRV
ncbi:MAG: hypothetical protein ACHQT8_04315 [Chlamydiales bacterium]